LQSISLPVFASLITSLTQGGGVMGRRSCLVVSRHPFGNLKPSPKRQAYLVAETTHSRTLWLLHDVKAVGSSD
jgi:hypothetical protein